MANPDIPGFYYDERKKKYFRIVNGDQRHNSNYHNNTVRAQSRQRQYLSEVASKRPKHRSDTAEVSRNAQIRNVPDELYLSFLRNQLGQTHLHHSNQSRIKTEFDYSQLEPILDHPIWAGLDDDQVFIGNHLTLELHYTSDLLLLTEEERWSLGLHHISPDTLDDKIICDVQHNGCYVFCQSSDTYSLLKWTCHRGRYRASNLTVGLKLAIATEMDTFPDRSDPPKHFVARFSGNLLHMICQKGMYFIFDAEKSKIITAFEIPCRQLQNIYLYGSIYVCKNKSFFNVANIIFAYDSLTKAFTKWNIKDPIYAFFLQPIEISGRKNSKDLILRLRLVTPKSIHNLDFNIGSSRFIAASPELPIYNSNQAKPLIQMVRGLLFVEETPKSFKIFNTNTNSVHHETLLSSLASKRTEKPRLIDANNVLFLSMSHKTFVFRKSSSGNHTI